MREDMVQAALSRGGVHQTGGLSIVEPIIYKTIYFRLPPALPLSCARCGRLFADPDARAILNLFELRHDPVGLDPLRWKHVLVDLFGKPDTHVSEGQFVTTPCLNCEVHPPLLQSID